MIDPPEELNPYTHIKVIGVGCAGSNVVAHMIERCVQGVAFICADANARTLMHSPSRQTIHLGESGRGTGGQPQVGRNAGEEAFDDIRASVGGAHMLFVTLDMGDGTGTGAAPLVARVARQMGILTVGVVILPFNWDGSRGAHEAGKGLAELAAAVDALIVIPNETPLDTLGDEIVRGDVFGHANDVIGHAIGGIAGIINGCGPVAADFEDVRVVMSAPGRTMMGAALSSGPDRARIASEQAVTCPLLEGIDLSGAAGMVVLVAASRNSFRLKELKAAMETIRACASPDAHVICGKTYDDTLDEEMRVIVIATGLPSR